MGVLYKSQMLLRGVCVIDYICVNMGLSIHVSIYLSIYLSVFIYIHTYIELLYTYVHSLYV